MSQTPLHVAAASDQFEVVKVLLDAWEEDGDEVAVADLEARNMVRGPRVCPDYSYRIASFRRRSVRTRSEMNLEHEMNRLRSILLVLGDHLLLSSDAYPQVTALYSM